MPTKANYYNILGGGGGANPPWMLLPKGKQTSTLGDARALQVEAGIIHTSKMTCREYHRVPEPSSGFSAAALVSHSNSRGAPGVDVEVVSLLTRLQRRGELRYQTKGPLKRRRRRLLQCL